MVKTLLIVALLVILSGCSEPVEVANGNVLMCQSCHGRGGVSTLSGVPHLRGQNQAYLLQQLRDYHSGARKHPQMSAIARSLTEQDMQFLSQYFAELGKDSSQLGERGSPP